MVVFFCMDILMSVVAEIFYELPQTFTFIYSDVVRERDTF